MDSQSESSVRLALMKLLTKASRIKTALQVIQHMNDDIAGVIASEIVGLSRSS